MRNSNPLPHEPSRLRLQCLDQRRAETLTSFTILLGAVRDADVAAERTAVKVAGRRLAALRTATAHLRSLMEPYLTASQRKLFDQAAGA
jgi:hypothetical protein